MAWYKVAEAADTLAPYLRKINAGGKNICLVYTGTEAFALGSICPHAGADLSKGWCENGKLICPFHRYAYDLQTGKGAPGQHDFVLTYPVRIDADGIYINVNSRLQKFIRWLGL
jgi:nitrite reductase/ring-hydroxylating ferredoxin subunit